MATLNTLRTRGALFLSIVIGVALIAFLLGDLTSASSIFRNKQNRVGSINGNNIDHAEFASANDNMNNTIQTIYGRNSLSSEETDRVRDMVWESYMRRYSYNPGYRKLGLAAGHDEQLDMIKGQYVSPVIREMFTSPETQLYDPTVVEGFISNMEYDEGGNMSIGWNYIKDEMINERVLSKYMTLVGEGMYVNSLEVAHGVKAANNIYTGKYVSLPFSTIADSLVRVTSSEVKKYYNEHKKSFKQTASRDIEYVVFDLLPSESDYAEAATYVNNIADEFAVAESPTQYASLNSQSHMDSRYYSEDQLSAEQATIAFGSRKGEMAGPTLNGDVYTIARVADERMMPDSVGVRHILLQGTSTATADSLVKAIKGGKSIFELASLYSADPTVDLGIFPPEMVVEPFANAIIVAKKGDIFSVETQYGTHVVEVTYKAPLVKKVQIATISYNVEPSAMTQQTVYNKARDFLTSAAGSREKFDAAVSQTAVSKRVATITEYDRNVRGLNDSRELVRWSYNTKPGTVSTIMEIDGDYVVAVMTGAKDTGIADINDVSNDIAVRIRNNKRAEILKERLAGKSIDQAATLEGVSSGDLESLQFSSFYIPNLGVEHAVIGAFDGVTVGSVSKPIIGLSGVYLVSVDMIDRTEDATDASEKVRLEAVAETSLAQRTQQALIEETKVVDNRVKFF